MRLHYLLTQDLESPSGLGRYWPLAREMSHRRHRVQITALHSNFESLTENQQMRDGVRIHYVSQMHVLKIGSEKRYYSSSGLLKVAAQASWRLAQQAVGVPADILHIAKPHPMNGIAGVLYRLLNNRNLFLDCDDYEAGSSRFSAGWQQKVVEFFEQGIPRLSRFVTTNTLFMKKNLLSWGIPEERIVYIPNGVDMERFRHLDRLKAAELASQYDLVDRPVIAYIGTMSLPSHPVDLLVEAFAQILTILPQALLVLVGGGENIPDLMQLAEKLGITNSVRFVGRVEPEAVADYYALADVTVDPVYDNPAARGRSPLKLFESWASGVPFVTADVGDRKALVGDPPAGLLCSPGDAQDLSEKILAVLQNPTFSRQLVERGTQRLPEYTWEHLAGIMEAAYLSIDNEAPESSRDVGA